ncbi:MAG: hypothetical protein E3J60_01575 [Dehalococcoidia bacterium]|nr:MAG: hypothetical protein E3J60_01575 [Dehalococcoidia bacterium]
MADEARKALTRLGMKLGAYANMGEHTVLEAAAWDIVLLDLHEVERGFAELEDYKRLAEKRLDLWSEDYHRLKGELEKLTDYMRKFEPFKTWAEEDAVTVSYPPAQELLDKLVATLIDHGPLMYRAIHPEENKVREIMARVIGPALMLPVETDMKALICWGKSLIEIGAIEPRWENNPEWMEMSKNLRFRLLEKEVPPLQSEKPLSKIFIGVDLAHDKGDETCVTFTRKNDDGSATILAVLRGEAAEYVAELEDNFNDLSHRFSCVLEHATGGTMSKTNYTKGTMYREIDGHIQDLCDEAVKELKDSLPKRTLRWDGERRDGDGAYVCIYCDEELPRFGAIVHKADCIQATMF